MLELMEVLLPRAGIMALSLLWIGVAFLLLRFVLLLPVHIARGADEAPNGALPRVLQVSLVVGVTVFALAIQFAAALQGRLGYVLSVLALMIGIGTVLTAVRCTGRELLERHELSRDIGLLPLFAAGCVWLAGQEPLGSVGVFRLARAVRNRTPSLLDSALPTLLGLVGAGVLLLWLTRSCVARIETRRLKDASW